MKNKRQKQFLAVMMSVIMLFCAAFPAGAANLTATYTATLWNTIEPDVDLNDTKNYSWSWSELTTGITLNAGDTISAVTGDGCDSHMSGKGNIIAYYFNDSSKIPSIAGDYYMDCKEVNESPIQTINGVSSWILGAYGEVSGFQMCLALYPAPPSYTVKYYVNGGSGEPKVFDNISAGDYTLESVVSAWGWTPPTDKVFLGWCTDSSCSGTVYSVGSTYSLSDSTEFYAKWADPCDVTYVCENNSKLYQACPVGLKHKLYSLSDLGFDTPTTGIFKGWTVGTDTTVRQAGYEITLTGNTTITAVIEKIEIKESNVTVTENGEVEVNAGGILEENKDYVVAYYQGENSVTEFTEGEIYTAKITGKGMYTGTVEKNFKYVAPEYISIADAVITLKENSADIVSVVLNDIELTEGYDYTFQYTDESGKVIANKPTAPGKYKVTIIGWGAYNETASKTFTITDKSNQGGNGGSSQTYRPSNNSTTTTTTTTSEPKTEETKNENSDKTGTVSSTGTIAPATENVVERKDKKVTSNTVNKAIENAEDNLATIAVSRKTAEITKSALKTMIESGTTIDFNAGTYNIRIDPDNITTPKSLDLGIRITQKIKTVNGKKLPENALAVRPDQKGNFGGKVEITIAAEKFKNLDLDKLKVYRVNSSGKPVLIKNAFVVNEDGSVTLTTKKSYTFIFTDKTFK